MLENTFNHQHDSDDAYHYRPVSTLQIIGVWQLVHNENKLATSTETTNKNTTPFYYQILSKICSDLDRIHKCSDA
jgi:hypothetical protein